MVMPKARITEKSEPYPIRIGEKLNEEIRLTMTKTTLKKPDVMRMAMTLGMPLLRSRFSGKK